MAQSRRRAATNRQGAETLDNTFGLLQAHPNWWGYLRRIAKGTHEEIVVVTGASRDAGKGIALAFGAAGATVYVTGRSVAGGDSPYGGTVAETAQLITEAGGKGIAVAVDHADDQAVDALQTHNLQLAC